jgi:hypothetical protein
MIHRERMLLRSLVQKGEAIVAMAMPEACGSVGQRAAFNVRAASFRVLVLQSTDSN